MKAKEPKKSEALVVAISELAITGNSQEKSEALSSFS